MQHSRSLSDSIDIREQKMSASMSMSDAALQVQAASGNGSADLLDDPNAADNSGGDYESGRAVGGQGGMAKRRASSAMSVVSRALRISNFPPEMQGEFDRKCWLP